MVKSALFSNEPANDIAYVNIRDAADSHMQHAKKNCEQLWDVFEPYADPEFRIEIRNNFDARYWEMYLTVSLIKEGYEVSAPKPGPDVGIRFNGCRIWFEATSPTRGEDGKSDQIPDVKAVALGKEPVFQDVPNDKMLLRYLNAISEKRRQHMLWLEKSIVASADALVVAINPRRLRHDFLDADPPRILQVAYAIGQPYVVIDPKTTKPIEAGYQFRDKIKKASDSEVSTGVFLLKEYGGLSGLLCSRIDVANQPEKMGADFQLVENWWARAPMPDWFRLKGTFFRVDRTANGYALMRETHL